MDQMVLLMIIMLSPVIKLIIILFKNLNVILLTKPFDPLFMEELAIILPLIFKSLLLFDFPSLLWWISVFY